MGQSARIATSPTRRVSAEQMVKNASSAEDLATMREQLLVTRVAILHRSSTDAGYCQFSGIDQMKLVSETVFNFSLHRLEPK